MEKIISLSDWEQKNFINSSDTPAITVIFPSREIYFSPELLHTMHLNNETCPKTLDQWYELCHPEDHSKISRLESIIYGHENFFTLTRKLYCGDGFYRNFRLDAFIQRYSDGRPQKLIGNEILSLNAWLASASEGDLIECKNEYGRTKIFEAVRVQGVMTLNDVTIIEDLKQENLRLRREIQRRIFSPSGENPVENFLYDDSEFVLKNILKENIYTALNILTSNNKLKSLKRSLNDTDLIIGVSGLNGSGKSTVINAILGEKLIPEQTNIPIFCREGEIREAKIFYQDGRNENIIGSKFTASFITKNIISENFNPGHRKGIARIEISIPGALIPKGICFVDTPYSSSTLKNLLPELDMIIYVTPLRSRLKGSDYEYLKFIMEINGKIIFALSQIDLERDDTEAGKIIFSARDKILNDVKAIKDDMKNFCGKDFEVIPISAKNALEKFYDKKSQIWINSNLENFVDYVKEFRDFPLIYRAERTLKILENVENLKGSLNWKVQDVKDRLKKILTLKSPVNNPPLKIEINTNEFSNRQEKNLLSSVLISIKEHDFKRKFFSLEAFEGKRKAIFLGADKNQSMKLFSRLAHNLMLEKNVTENSEQIQWLYSGYMMPFECVELPVIGTDEDILIAPSDYELEGKKFDWKKIFENYTPVISVDLARIESGLSDLFNSPYIIGLTVKKWVLAFGNAGLFDNRKSELTDIDKIPKKIKEFSEINGIKNPDCFIFENYEIV